MQVGNLTFTSALKVTLGNLSKEQVVAITSSAFGRVTLTDEDAKKFDRQVKFGRSNAKASANVKEGRELALAFFASQGSLSKPPKR